MGLLKYCLKKYLRDNKINRFSVSSAGIEALPQSADPKIVEELGKLGVNMSKHEQRRLTQRIVDENDIIVSMGDQHYDFILKNFGVKSFYFNDLAVGKSVGIKDIWEVIPDHETNREAVESYISKVVSYIWSKTPKIAEELLVRNFLFEDFVNKRTDHRNGFPFIPVFESKHSIAFLSINIPKHQNGHVLVIPKKRYRDLDSIPKRVLNDLISSVSFIGRVIKKSHGGYNVLLNNGTDAGQYIFHTHFHLIPRSPNDSIQMGLWDSQDLTAEKFVEYSNSFKKRVEESKHS